jgi:hypothetical protein
MKYYIRTTHNLDGTYKGRDYCKDKVWQYADIGFIGHILDPYKYMTIDDINKEIKAYAKSYPKDGDYNVSKNHIEACLIILCKFGLAEELK